jgi:hypothetical protein
MRKHNNEAKEEGLAELRCRVCRKTLIEASEDSTGGTLQAICKSGCKRKAKWTFPIPANRFFTDERTGRRTCFV